MATDLYGSGAYFATRYRTQAAETGQDEFSGGSCGIWQRRLQYLLPSIFCRSRLSRQLLSRKRQHCFPEALALDTADSADYGSASFTLPVTDEIRAGWRIQQLLWKRGIGPGEVQP